MNIKVRGVKPPLYSVKEIIAAVKDSGGVKQTVVSRLGISRNTLNNYIRKHATVDAAMKAERRIVCDKAERNIFDKIDDGDVPVSQWYLTRKGGYYETREIDAKIDVNTKIDKTVTVKVEPAIAKMIGDNIVQAEYKIIEAEEQKLIESDTQKEIIKKKK